MTKYLEQNVQYKNFEPMYYSPQIKNTILHSNLPQNYYDKKVKRDNSKHTYIYQICWAIKYLRFELTHILK